MKQNIHILLSIFDFLDPFSLEKIKQTCKNFYQIVQNASQIYKKFCLLLYKFNPTLPELSPFKEICPHIEADVLSIPNHIVQLSKKDIRKLIWFGDEEEINQNFYKTPPSYYKKYDNWQKMFLNAPRVNFGGVYFLKERYIKVG